MLRHIFGTLLIILAVLGFASTTFTQASALMLPIYLGMFLLGVELIDD